MEAQERILVVVSASDTAIGRAIRRITASPVNHAFILYESRLWGGWWAAQIGPKGVEKLAASKVRKECSTVECYEYRGDLSPGLVACRNMVGEAYDFLGVAGFLVKLAAWRVARRKIKNPWHLQNAEFCSEFVSRILKAAAVDGFADCDPPSMAPGDVRDLVQANDRFTSVEWPA
jgi:hypothetical protein